MRQLRVTIPGIVTRTMNYWSDEDLEAMWWKMHHLGAALVWDADPDTDPSAKRVALVAGTFVTIEIV